MRLICQEKDVFPGVRLRFEMGNEILSRDIIKYVACTYMSDMICACHGDR